jgi:hypothetical protein
MGQKGHASPNLIIRGSLSGLVGIVFGIAISLIVNCTLVEISLSSFFSMYFGILFIFVGVIILWRVWSQDSYDGQSRPKTQLAAFAVLIIISGVISIVLERDWFVGLRPTAKVPLYSLLGISVSFALVFSVVDFVNYAYGFFQAVVAKPLVESMAQVNLVIMTAIVMGGIFGTMFGYLDVEDAAGYRVRLALFKEEHYCYPVGAILGGIAGFGNEYLREREEEHQPTVYDEDI